MLNPAMNSCSLCLRRSSQPLLKASLCVVMSSSSATLCRYSSSYTQRHTVSLWAVVFIHSPDQITAFDWEKKKKKYINPRTGACTFFLNSAMAPRLGFMLAQRSSSRAISFLMTSGLPMSSSCSEFSAGSSSDGAPSMGCSVSLLAWDRHEREAREKIRVLLLIKTPYNRTNSRLGQQPQPSRKWGGQVGQINQ